MTCLSAKQTVFLGTLGNINSCISKNKKPSSVDTWIWERMFTLSCLRGLSVHINCLKADKSHSTESAYCPTSLSSEFS